MKAALPGLEGVLAQPACLGVDSIQLVARQPFWDEEALPFAVHGAGAVLRLVPRPGFSQALLAASPDELATLAKAPEGGWLVPSSTVAGWLDRNVAVDRLDDILLAHLAYESLVRGDARGHSRIGRGRLVHWTPGLPTLAALRGPELPGGARATAKARQEYAERVQDLVAQVEAAFPLAEAACSLAFKRGKRA